MIGLVVDNFAGGGGASTGIEAALGRAIDIAINHDPEAVAMHTANHPDTLHYCQSVWRADPREVAAGRPAALAWFSPDCKHFSKAKGGKPVEKNIRDLAWVVVLWAQRVRPAVIMLENVEEFRTWGPLAPDGRPDKERAGEEFARWTKALRKEGYKLQWKELRACDYGAPTSRKRFFLIARCDGQPIVWPAPTHGKPGSAEVLAGTRLPWRTAASIIDWSIRPPSIFDRTRPLAENTNRRIAAGVMRYVVNAAAPFIVPVTNSTWNPDRTWSGDEPLRTATTAKGGEFAVVAPSFFPTTHHGADRTYGPGDPVRTVTGAHRGEIALAAATMIQTGYGERPGQAPRVPHIDKPLGAAVAGGIKHAPVAAFISHYYTSNTNGGRGEPTKPFKTICTGAQGRIIAAHMEQANTGMVGHDARRPVSTIVGRGTTQRLVETTLVPADALPPELMQRATLVAAFLVKYYGAAQHGQAADQPLDTVTALPRFAVVTVTIDAATYILVDIGMRMLTPRELARAQGFPDSYVLDAIGPNGKPLSKTAQTRMIGNSVNPQLSEALARANLMPAATEREAA
jgi:DNA (cytosine-5)-methyltransferase 1